uniref:Uncharacterized protein n=1 Tax=Moniliophthora roreri TaxID=221103 RepID=A0A0W0G436_MONRR
MAKLVATKAAPKHAVAPLPINTKSLFSLDIDDAIWQDVGLSEESGDPFSWLADDNYERDSMQKWFAEEWTVICNAIDKADTDGIKHQLKLKKLSLVKLLVTWQRAFVYVQASEGVSDWSLSKRELDTQCQILHRDVVIELGNNSDSEGDSKVEVDEDTTLIEYLDQMLTINSDKEEVAF